MELFLRLLTTIPFSAIWSRASWLSGSVEYSNGSLLKFADWLVLRLSFFEKLSVGRKMMLVMVSGLHSSFICAFHELLRE